MYGNDTGFISACDSSVIVCFMTELQVQTRSKTVCRLSVFFIENIAVLCDFLQMF